MDQIFPKKSISVRKQKTEQHHWIQHIRISLSTKFQLQLIILIFWNKLSQTEYSRPKTKKWTSRLNSAYLNLFNYRVLPWTDNFNFLDQICPKSVFPIKSRKSGYHHWILHVRISVGNNFQFRLIIFIFWTKFAQKGYFQSETRKMNITTEFCMFELV